jgi:hypothetical protein
MADKKISQLTAASTPLAGTEVLPIVQSGSTVKVASDDLTVKNVRSNATTGILQVAGPGAGTTRVMTTPDANFTAARTDAAQNFAGNNTFDTNVLAIDAANNRVGINTTTPGFPLDVAGTASAQRSRTLAGAADDSRVEIVAPNDTKSPLVAFAVSGVRNSGIIGFPPGDDAFVYRRQASSFSDGTEAFRITVAGNVVAGASAALATTATNGFLYVPTCAGTPTGTPTAITGMAPIVVDTTNNKLYFYSTGVWRDAGP